MGNSNGSWGDAPNTAAQEHHDYWLNSAQDILTADSPLLDGFLDSKGLTREAMARVGARWLPPSTLVYNFPEGNKYRDVNLDRRWNSDGVEWHGPKIIRAADGGHSSTVVVVEGETDAAAVSEHLRDYDVAILPAGAKAIPPHTQRALEPYDRIILALDQDEAGDLGVTKLRELFPRAERYTWADHKDICEYLQHNPGTEPELESAPKQVFSIREVVAADLGTYEDNHWFAHGILPVRGQCIIHGGMKSLKSFVVVDLARALATGTTFAGEYSYLKDEPSKVLMFQFEVPPFDFQQRILGTMVDMTIPERELFMDNFYVHRIADNQWSRLKAREDLADYVGHLADSVGAGVVIFDPVQRMTGKADINSASEMDLVLGTYENLQTAGFTVVYVHHNNKANHNIADPYSMSGTQRFGADVDSICSMYHGKACIPDENSERRKQRNFAWTLRNGAAPARSITVAPRPENQDQVKTTFGPPIVAISSDDDENY